MNERHPLRVVLSPTENKTANGSDKISSLCSLWSSNSNTRKQFQYFWPIRLFHWLYWLINLSNFKYSILPQSIKILEIDGLYVLVSDLIYYYHTHGFKPYKSSREILLLGFFVIQFFLLFCMIFA